MKVGKWAALECALLLLASAALSFVRIRLWDNGGEVTLFSLLPLIVVARRQGTHAGLLCSLGYGLIRLFAQRSVLSPLGFWPALGAAALGFILCDTAVGFSSVRTARRHASARDFAFSMGMAFLARCVLKFPALLIEAGASEVTLAQKPLSWALMQEATGMLPEALITILAALLLNQWTRLMDRQGLLIDASAI